MQPCAQTQLAQTVGFVSDVGGPLLELPDELWQESLDIHVLNIVRLAHILIKQGGGSSANISSINTVEPRNKKTPPVIRAAFRLCDGKALRSPDPRICS